MKQSILKLEKCEIWDLTEALYTYCILWHDGQYSDLYSLQCEIGQHFRPGMGFSESTVETENEFYNEITEENARNIWNRVLYYLENRWED